MHYYIIKLFIKLIRYSIICCSLAYCTVCLHWTSYNAVLSNSPSHTMLFCQTLPSIRCCFIKLSLAYNAVLSNSPSHTMLFYQTLPRIRCCFVKLNLLQCCFILFSDTIFSYQTVNCSTKSSVNVVMIDSI